MALKGVLYGKKIVGIMIHFYTHDIIGLYFFPYILMHALMIPVVFVQVGLFHTFNSKRKYHNFYIIGYNYK